MRLETYFGKVFCLFLVSLLAACDGTTTSSSTSTPLSTSGQSTSSPQSVNTDTDSLSFSEANYTVAQSAGEVVLTVLRTGSSTTGSTVHFETSDDSALSTENYTATSGDLSWDAGNADPKTITVPLGTHTFATALDFKVVLSDPTSGLELGSIPAAMVTINPTPVTGTHAAGTVAFSAPTYKVVQSAGSLNISVDRTGGASGVASVHYKTGNGSAVSGNQYTAASGTLSWADGETAAKTIAIPVSKTGFTGSLNFSIALSDVMGAQLGAASSAIVTITGTGAAVTTPTTTAAILSLASGTTSVAQSAGTLSLMVDRSGGSANAVTVKYATASGTATAGKDFTTATGTLTWAAGDTAAKPVVVTISKTAFTGSRNFTLALSAPTGGATLGANADSTVTITGSGVVSTPSTPAATATTLAFASATYSVMQTAGSVSLSVNRSGGTTTAVSVGYSTADGSAVAGQNYTAKSGTLSWAAGDAAAKAISVPVSSTVISGAMTFSVKLATPSGATTASPAAATVTINKAGALSIAVKGNNLVDAQGNVVQLRGVNVSGLEAVSVFGWSPDNPWGSQTGDPTPNWTTIKSWGTNAVRIPLNEASWLGLTCVDEGGFGVTVVNGQQVQNKVGQSVKADPGGNYQATLQNTVATATAAGLYIILDLHITAPGNGCPNVQNPMADQEHSIAFWSSIAANFKGYPNVIFELFNEPFLDMTTALSGNDPLGDLLNGGGPLNSYLVQTGSSPYYKYVTYNWKNAGMQQMLDAVRATGSTNVVLVGNNSYSDDINNWLKYKATDSAGQLAASWHTYPGNDGKTLGCIGGQPACDATVKAAAVAVRAAGYPVVITEFGDAIGGSAPFASTFIPWADKNSINGYFGWTWDVWGGATSNVLITNAAGSPTAGYGTYVKAHYLCRAAGNATCP